MKTLKLKKIFGDKISNRSLIESFFKDNIKCTNDNKIIIDFSEITNISRSAAHQFDLELRAFDNNKPTIVYKNQRKEVKRIFDLVKNSQSKSIYSNYNRLSFDNQNQFFNYLSTL
ncbi:MAG: STAS domain-containing protein [Halanaerobiales bacterium]